MSADTAQAPAETPVAASAAAVGTVAETANIVMRLLEELQPHPLSLKVYGQEVVDPELVESIRINGILEPLIINDKDQIISGSRRARAAKQAGITHVPAVLKKFENGAEENFTVLEANRQRKKTNEQLVREYAEFKLMEAFCAKGRQLRPNLPQGKKGKAGEIAAEQVGIYGRSTLEKGVAVLHVLGELAKDESNADVIQDITREVNKRSIDAGYRKCLALKLIEGKTAKKPPEGKKHTIAQRLDELCGEIFASKVAELSMEDRDVLEKSLKRLGEFYDQHFGPEISPRGATEAPGTIAAAHVDDKVAA